MVPAIPSVSRRRVLAGAGSVLALGTVGLGAAAPTALPDVLTDEATKHYPTPPEVDELWQPTVTEDHARTVVERLAAVVDRAEPLWDGLDTDRHFTGAGGWLENAREELDAGNYNAALREATAGLGYAAEDLGFARAKRDDADLQALAERTLAVRERATSVLKQLSDYRVGDPGVDLAWYLSIERAVHSAHRRANWSAARAAANGVDDADGPNAAGYDADRVAALAREAFRAEVDALNAERFRDYLEDRLDGDATAYADHLAAVADDFRSRLDDRPDREALRARYGLDDADEFGPYEFAHARLLRWCFNSWLPAPWALEDEPLDLRLMTALALGGRVLGYRALEFATGEVVVDESDTGFDSGHVLAEKRRARRTYQDAIGDSPPPLLAEQAARAIEDLQVAVVGFADSYRTPLWKERLQAYLYALAGRAKLEHHPRIYRRIADAN